MEIQSYKASNHTDLYEKLNILINNSELRKNLIKSQMKMLKDLTDIIL